VLTVALTTDGGFHSVPAVGALPVGLRPPLPPRRSLPHHRCSPWCSPRGTTRAEAASGGTIGRQGHAAICILDGIDAAAGAAAAISFLAGIERRATTVSLGLLVDLGWPTYMRKKREGRGIVHKKIEALGGVLQINLELKSMTCGSHELRAKRTIHPQNLLSWSWG